MGGSRGAAEMSVLDKIDNGAAEGTRTPDPLITNEVLYQLSYRGPGAVRQRA